MDQKQASKLLFKKLSALRATLSDEEQLLLDSLLVGEFAVTAHGLVAAGNLTLDAEGATTRKTNVASSLGKLASNAEDTVAHKLNVASSLNKLTTDIEDATAHSALLNEDNERLAALRLTVVFNNEDENYRLTIL